MKRIMNNELGIRKHNFAAFTIIFYSIFLIPYSTPVFAQPATEYQLLAPIPGYIPTTADNKTTPGPYIKGIFNLAIAVAGGLAVIMIIFGGIKYMSTDAWTGKNEARGIIENAIWGLLLAIGAWLILYTINPKLVDFDLKISSQPTTAVASVPPPGGPPAGCASCVVVSVPHKSAPTGCAAPGPCTVDPALNNKLVTLNALDSLLVTESFPPTRPHTDACHNNGTCVDATTGCTTPQCIQKFIADAGTVGLRAEFEVKNEARAQAIRQATGLSASQVRVRPEITGEHYSVYLS